MRYSLVFSLLVTFLMFFFSSCEKDSTPPGETSPTGTLTIYLTDSPAMVEFDSVNITFSQVSAHLDSEWVTVQGNPITVNLLDLVNGNTIIFGSAEVPAGKYTQIRIKIDNAYVVLTGQQNPIPMTVPSGAQTGLKLGPQFTVVEGATYEMVVDFDVSRSIVVTGPPSNPGYKLKPHLRIMPLALSGSITGTVTNPENSPTAFAIQGNDTINTSIVNQVDGFFRLSFLPAGSYTVSIRDALDRSATRDGVAVVAGLEKYLGDIELQ
jgi:hypothetical protein